MPDSIAPADVEATLAAWIERHVGKVVRIEKQPRWRAAWAVDVEKDGELIPLYVKGPRGMNVVVPVKLEGRALQLLNQNNIPAPFQYGYCEELDAIIMERLPGESRLELIGDVAERDSVVDQYIQAMVDFHRLDPRLFEAEGFRILENPRDLRLVQFQSVETMYLEKKAMPEPCNEFLRLWVNKNVPGGDFKPAFITGDAFQMIYHQGKLKAVMDLEMACIGDPLFDLACIRMRDLSEKTGDAARITKLYEKLSGEKLDLDALRFHLAAIATASSLLISEVMTHPTEDTDYFEYFVYYHGSLRVGLEAVAERMDIQLGELTVPVPAETQQAVHLKMLEHATQQLPTATEMDVYKRGKALAEIAYLERRDRYGVAFDAAYLDDIAKLLGRRPTDVKSAEAELEHFVHDAGPEFDRALVQLFHRRALAECYLADIPQNQRLSRFLRETIAPLQ